MLDVLIFVIRVLGPNGSALSQWVLFLELFAAASSQAKSSQKLESVSGL